MITANIWPSNSVQPNQNRHLMLCRQFPVLATGPLKSLRSLHVALQVGEQLQEPCLVPAQNKCKNCDQCMLLLARKAQQKIQWLLASKMFQFWTHVYTTITLCCHVLLKALQWVPYLQSWWFQQVSKCLADCRAVSFV